MNHRVSWTHQPTDRHGDPKCSEVMYSDAVQVSGQPFGGFTTAVNNASPQGTRGLCWSEGSTASLRQRTDLLGYSVIALDENDWFPANTNTDALEACYSFRGRSSFTPYSWQSVAYSAASAEPTLELDSFPEENKALQSMNEGNGKSRNSLEQLTAEMFAISFILAEFWTRPLSGEEMNRAMAFPNVYNEYIDLLKTHEKALKAATGLYQEEENSALAEKVVTSHLGSLENGKDDDLREKFSEKALENNDGRYRRSLGESISKIVKELKELSQ